MDVIRDFPGTSFDGCNFLVEMSNFEQAIKMTFGRKKFGKGSVKNLKTRIYFQKKSRDQVVKNIDQLQLSKSIPNVSFKFISCQSRNFQIIICGNE